MKLIISNMRDVQYTNKYKLWNGAILVLIMKYVRNTRRKKSTANMNSERTRIIFCIEKQYLKSPPNGDIDNLNTKNKAKEYKKIKTIKSVI